MLMEQTPNGFRAEVPPKRRISATAFFAFFISFSGVVGYFLMRRSDGAPALFALVVALTLVISGGCGLFAEWFGKEFIELDNARLYVSDRIFGLGARRAFDISLMKDLRFGASEYWQGGTYVMSPGRIQFEYEGKMISIGGNVDEDEAFAIVQAIRNQLTTEKISR